MSYRSKRRSLSFDHRYVWISRRLSCFGLGPLRFTLTMLPISYDPYTPNTRHVILPFWTISLPKRPSDLVLISLLCARPTVSHHASLRNNTHTTLIHFTSRPKYRPPNASKSSKSLRPAKSSRTSSTASRRTSDPSSSSRLPPRRTLTRLSGSSRRKTVVGPFTTLSTRCREVRVSGTS